MKVITKMELNEMNKIEIIFLCILIIVGIGCLDKPPPKEEYQPLSITLRIDENTSISEEFIIELTDAQATFAKPIAEFRIEQ